MRRNFSYALRLKRRRDKAKPGSVLLTRKDKIKVCVFRVIGRKIIADYFSKSNKYIRHTYRLSELEAL